LTGHTSGQVGPAVDAAGRTYHPHVHHIATRDGLVFDALVEGPEDGEPVLLLHGFPQSRHSWRSQLPVLAAAGYRCVAPDQRGYSAGARPDPADLTAYRLDALVQDVVDLADACGWEHRRFHLVGHDWGGMVAWTTAFRHPDRLASLSVLSRPHPLAFQAALRSDDGDQRHRSRHHRAFLDGDTAGMLLADDAARLRRSLLDGGVPEATVADYVSVLGTREALEAALAWYRAVPGLAVEVGAVSVPTLYVWGDADATVGRAAAEGTAEHVSGAYRFEVLPEVGHFASDQVPQRVGELLLAHLAAHPAGAATP
jgi:pimeloyl-ACP methyl ester carboxylesterase